MVQTQITRIRNFDGSQTLRKHSDGSTLPYSGPNLTTMLSGVTDPLQPGQQYEILKAASKQCPNPECKSSNFAAVISDEDIDSSFLSEKKQGKYRHILLEGRPYPDGKGCTCPPFKREMELKAAAIGEKDWEPTLPIQICPHCDKEYHLDWTVTERNYF